MHPYLFNNKNIDTFIFMIVLGLVVAFALFSYLCKRERISLRVYLFYMLTFASSIFIGFLCASYMQKLYNYIDHLKTGVPYSPLGMTFFGGLIGGVAAFVLTVHFLGGKEDKAAFFKIVNIASPSLVLAHAFGRLGCYCGGCCYGIKSERFGVKFPTTRHKVLPTNLYESLFLFALAAVMLILYFVKNKDKILILIYGYAYSVFRFIIEFFRGDERGEFLPLLSPSQWQSIFMLAVIIAVTLYLYKYKNKTKAKSENKE